MLLQIDDRDVEVASEESAWSVLIACSPSPLSKLLSDLHNTRYGLHDAVRLFADSTGRYARIDTTRVERCKYCYMIGNPEIEKCNCEEKQ
jgi:hypothetical protein